MRREAGSLAGLLDAAVFSLALPERCELALPADAVGRAKATINHALDPETVR